MNNKTKTPSSRALARKWPYPRRVRFQDAMRQMTGSYFAEKGYAVNAKYDYILAEYNDWPKNIILPEVVNYINEVREKREVAGEGFALHKYIHHGLSSQAMIFNLIGPLIVRRDLTLLQSVFGQQGLDWPDGPINAILEYEDRAIFNEDSGQPTSIDLVLTDEREKPFVFVEFKFTEEGFGGCSVFAGGDCDGRNPANVLSLCYLHFIGRRYWTLMEKHGFLEGGISQDSLCVMATYYQFFRIVLFALEHNKPCVLLSDARSPSFFNSGKDGQQPARGQLSLLMKYVPEVVRPMVKAVTIQDVVAAIKESGRHTWISELERKYGLESG